jgi:hypothetical protein
MSKNKNFTANQVIEQIELIYGLFNASRFALPLIPFDNIEEDSTQDYNKPEFKKPAYNFPSETLRNYQIKDKDIGYYLRQNFLIRLRCILEFYGAYEDFENKKLLSGYAELEILTSLRNRFSHTFRVFHPKDKKLTKIIVKHFNLPDMEYKEIPIPTKEVIDPIFEKSIQYIKELFKKP